MESKYFTSFDNLAVSLINDGRGAPDMYLRGPVVDLTYGVTVFCMWSWKDVGPQVGLCFVKCKVCGSNSQVVLTGGGGSIKLPCNESTYVAAPEAGASTPGPTGPISYVRR